MSNTSDELYQEFNELDEWQQGDIIEGLYIAKVLEDDLYIHRPHPELCGRISLLTQSAKVNSKVALPFSNSQNRELAIIPVYKLDVMIVSQTCDIVNDKQVTVARVRPFRHKNKPELQELIRCGNVMYAFYLPDYPETAEESFAHLGELTVLSKKLLETHKEQRKRSLSSTGIRIFQLFIERFFGREAMPDSVSRIITEFNRNLQETEIADNVERIYYCYSSEEISLLVALNEEDYNTKNCVEIARNYAMNSVEQDHEVKVMHKLVDDISLRDIEGFREFR